MSTGAQNVSELSTTAQILFAAVPLLAVAFVGVLGFFQLLWEHRRRLMILEKGGVPPRGNLGRRALLIGLISLFIGVGLIVFVLATEGPEQALLSGIVPACAGLALVVYDRLFVRNE